MASSVSGKDTTSSGQADRIASTFEHVLMSDALTQG